MMGWYVAAAMLPVIVAVVVGVALRRTRMRQLQDEEARDHALDLALLRQSEQRKEHWLASDQERLGARGGDKTGYLSRHDTTMKRFHQAGGYE